MVAAECRTPKLSPCIAGDLPLGGGFAGKLGGAAACWRRAVARIIRGCWSQRQRAHSGNTNFLPQLGFSVARQLAQRLSGSALCSAAMALRLRGVSPPMA